MFNRVYIYCTVFIEKIIGLYSYISCNKSNVKKINLCSASQIIPEYLSVDFIGKVDLRLDLEKSNLPFDDNSLDSVVCMSAINYFTRSRGQEIVNEVYRVLRKGGVTRFGVQDLFSLARRYVDKDTEFYNQLLPNGSERFQGATIADKFVQWFYGHAIKGHPCRYFYDYDSLALLFQEAGFSVVERKAYLESRLEHIELIDNRPEQMFYLEAIK
jgi:predicted SAM-dependent methyltransferase